MDTLSTMGIIVEIWGIYARKTQYKGVNIVSYGGNNHMCDDDTVIFVGLGIL